MRKVQAADFDDLYRKYSPLIYRRCLSFFKNEEQAIDAMQDVFVRILEQQEKIREFSSTVFYVITTRVCLNKLRANQTRNCFFLDEFIETLPDSAGNIVEEKIYSKILLESIFENSSYLDKQMAILHYLEGLTLEETANICKFSVSGVRKRLRKLKEKANKIFMETKNHY